MSKRNKIILSTIAGILFLFIGMKGFDFLASQKEPPKEKSKSSIKPLATVEAIQLEKSSFDIPLEGVLQAYNKVMVFTEVPGLINGGAKPFKVGTYFSKGESILTINKEEAQLALLAQKSDLLSRIVSLLPDIKLDFPDDFNQWQDYVDGFDLELPLKDFPEMADNRGKRFIAARNLSGLFYSIKSAEKRIDKYEIKAPFSGVLTAVNTNAGAMVQPGQMLGEFMQTGHFELVVSVLASDMRFLGKGQSVAFYAQDLGTNYSGRIKRISNKINPQSQTVDVYITIKGKGLKEGLFLTGSTQSNAVEDIYVLDKALLLGQDEAFFVEDGQLVRKHLDILRITEAGIYVQGLIPGATILAKQIPGAFEGMEVDVQVIDSTSPKQ